MQLDVVLTDAWVNRYAVAPKGARSELTLAREVPRLRRLIRALAGEAARTRRGPRAEGTAPCSDDDLTRLDEAGLGIEGVLVLAADVAAVPRCRENAKVRGGCWLAARSVADTAGVDLTLDKVAAASMARLMSSDQDDGVLVNDHELLRRSLESSRARTSRRDAGAFGLDRPVDWPTVVALAVTVGLALASPVSWSAVEWSEKAFDPTSAAGAEPSSNVQVEPSPQGVKREPALLAVDPAAAWVS